MLKRKFRTSRKYVGRRKNPNLARRNRKVAVDSTDVEVDDYLGQTSSKSSSAKSWKYSVLLLRLSWKVKVTRLHQNQSATFLYS